MEVNKKNENFYEISDKLQQTLNLNEQKMKEEKHVFSEPLKTSSKVFVNRSLDLNKIKCFGFDMDYTLAVYKSPDYEELGFELTRERLIQCGYPKELRKYVYDASFPTRGIIFDRLFGNFLKVDTLGSVLTCVKGFQFLKSHEIVELYPDHFIQLGDTDRFYIFNTLFDLPEIYMLACIIDYFHQDETLIAERTEFKNDSFKVKYSTIQQDVRSAVDHIHCKGDLGTRTLENLNKYVHRQPNIGLLLDRMAEKGKVVLVTNSEFEYTNKMMNYLFDNSNDENKRSWLSYFDLTIVSAKKPLFFSEGTVLREVNLETGCLNFGHYTGKIKKGSVYSGGSTDLLFDLIDAKSDEILYIGDHLYGDILKSKKQKGWRTFLVVPEIQKEISFSAKNQVFSKQIKRLFCDVTGVSPTCDIDKDKNEEKIAEISATMDKSIGRFGGLFRSGVKQTFFAGQVQRYADLYSSSFINLLWYSFSNFFYSPLSLMPHERSAFDDESKGGRND